MTDAQRLLLLFPPLAVATSPPLGIAALKGFINKQLPEWDVRLFDLNLEFHDYLIAMAAKGKMAGTGLFSPYEEVALLRAAEVFQGQNSSEFFQQSARYSLYADLWLRLTTNELSSFRALQRCYEQRGPFPPLLEEWGRRIVESKPTLVGFSVCYTQQLWISLCLAAIIRRDSKAGIVFGGTYFNRVSDNFLLNYQDVFDLVIAGEGELALAQLLASPQDLDNVPGGHYVKDGQVFKSSAKLETKLDLLGLPDYGDFDLHKYYSPHPVVPVLTSRGCYWRRCAFCVHYKSAGQTYRVRSIDSVLKEIEGHYLKGIKYFAFIDEMLAPKHFLQLAEAINSTGMKINYYALAKPVRQFDAQVFKTLHGSGCRYIIWGVESGSQRLLDLMNKGTVVSDIAAVLRDSRSAGIYNHVYIMAGFPSETAAEFQSSLDFLRDNRSAIACVHRGIFHLEYGSLVFDNPNHFGITRHWPAPDAMLQGWYEFECSSGMGRQEVKKRFSDALPMLRDFNPYSRFLGNFRDHALLIYSNLIP